MDCFACCTASSYRINALCDSLSATTTTTRMRDVVQLLLKGKGGEEQYVLFFDYGVTVSWGLSDKELIPYLQLVAPFEEESLPTMQKDHNIFNFGDKAAVIRDTLILPRNDPLEIVAVSHAIAQSVKLENFENRLETIFEENKRIPEQLALEGKIPFSRRTLRRKIGQLIIERNAINLQCNVLDTPEFFWQQVELEPIYKLVANYLALRERVAVLNQRLGIVHDLFDMLSNELNHQHSSRLEWIIIWLIISEVALSLLRDVFHIL